MFWRRRSEQASAPSASVNVNTATKAELLALRGVGDSLADQIISGRPWGSLTDLQSIRGINATTIEQWGLTL
jgi:DNA uptake protein ComE-like DNA-binding protein